MRLRFPFLALVCLAFVPQALAHAAPDPREQDTRLLADWNDDCGGDGGAATGACRGSIDLIALDVYERHDAQLGDVVAFRFTLDKGSPGPHMVTLKLDAGGSRKTFSLQSSDDSRFTGTGFDAVGDAVGIHDGTRFTVDALAKRSAFGDVGAALREFLVESSTSSGVGDFMPGGCHNAIGDCVDAGKSTTAYVRPSYILRGPRYYGDLSAPSTVQVKGKATVELSLKNGLRRTPQSFTLLATAPPGSQISFLDEANQEKATIRIDLAGGAAANVRLVLRSTASSGEVDLEWVSDLGGRSVLAFPFAAEGEEPAASTDSSTATASKPSAAPVGLLAVLLAAALRRHVSR